MSLIQQALPLKKNTPSDREGQKLARDSSSRIKAGLYRCAHSATHQLRAAHSGPSKANSETELLGHRSSPSCLVSTLPTYLKTEVQLTGATFYKTLNISIKFRSTDLG